MINKLKEYVLLREIALVHDYIPDLDDMTLPDVMEDIDNDFLTITDYHLDELIREHDGYSLADIEDKVFTIIKEADE